MTKDEIGARVLPQFFPAHWLEHPGIAFSDFPSRIRIGYVLRNGGSYSHILNEQLNALAIPLSELHESALSNLRQLSSGAMSFGKVPGGAEGWIHATDDNFAAIRILLPEVQQEFARELEEPFLVALSHRDDCFCWSRHQPQDRQQKHIREALERFLVEEYNLTPDVLLFSGGKFSLYIEQAAGQVSLLTQKQTSRAG
jgi:hypothetical protein